MSRVIRTIAALTAVVAALTPTAACGPDDPAPPSTTTVTPSSSTSTESPTSTTSVESADEKDSRLAADSISIYWKTLDQLASTPTKSLTDLSAIAVDPALAQWQRILTLRRGGQVTQAGATRIEAAPATKKSSDLWDVTACVDVSRVTLVDKDGKSVVKADRPPKVRYAYVVKKIQDQFFVTEDQAVGLC